jgi:hypothetical protein
VRRGIRLDELVERDGSDDVLCTTLTAPLFAPSLPSCAARAA